MMTPRPHQVDAIRECVRGLRKSGSRGQCIMACGTGKTFVGHEVSKQLGARRTLVLVPSLLLVNQTIREYRAFGTERILSVCSEEDDSSGDVIRISVKDLDADNTARAEDAKAFLDGGGGQRVVVSTYQSLRALSGVFSDLEFDLAIFDEAHKTAGERSKLFSHGISDDHVKCARRLFLTATPRHAELKDDGDEAPVYAMNDPEIYGPVLYSLTLRAAIEAGIIDDYRIIVALVDGDVGELGDQAVRVAIDQAMRAYGIRKVFTFHGSVKAANGFILGATDTLKGSRLYHVNGNQPSDERGLKLEGFAAADAALMSNAQCLTEGVDLPAADMVAFLSRKKNPIGIVQAVGRVLRKHHSKAKGGFVFLPVFVRPGQDEEAAIYESDWRCVYDVLQAMREQDEPLAVQLAKCARGEGDLPSQMLIMDVRRRAVGADGDVIGASDVLRKAIRAKVMRAFVMNSAWNKMALLERARGGEMRPSSTSMDPVERRLAHALNNYTSPTASTFDAKFNRDIRRLAPNWFDRIDPDGKDRELIRIAKESGECPNSRTSLGCRLSHLKKSATHPITVELMRIRPEWFPGFWEKRLVELADSGAPRPRRDSPEGVRLRAYSSPSHRSYRPELIDLLKRKAPAWWLSPKGFSRAERGLPPRPAPKWKQDKQGKMHQLEELAGDGARRPKMGTMLGNAFRNYTNSSSKAFVPEWTEKMRFLAPNWF